MTLGDFLFGPPRYVPDTPWRASGAIAATFLMFFAAQLVALAVFSWLGEPFFGDLSPRMDAAGSGAAQPAMMAWLLLTQSVMAGLVVLAAGFFGGSVRRVLKLMPPVGGGRVLAHAVLVMTVLLGTFNALAYWFNPSSVVADLQVYVGFLRSDAWPLAALAIGLGAPLMEELVFRGFLQSALARSPVGFWPGALLATAAWTALHWGYSATGLTEVFLIGVYFSWLLWRTGSIWPALFCHALYNSGLMLALRWAPLPG